MCTIMYVRLITIIASGDKLWRASAHPCFLCHHKVKDSTISRHRHRVCPVPRLARNCHRRCSGILQLVTARGRQRTSMITKLHPGRILICLLHPTTTSLVLPSGTLLDWIASSRFRWRLRINTTTRIYRRRMTWLCLVFDNNRQVRCGTPPPLRFQCTYGRRLINMTLQNRPRFVFATSSSNALLKFRIRHLLM